MKNRIEIPFNLWIIIISGSIYSYFFSPNFFLITPILFYIPFIYKLFFVKGNPNIIFWGLLFQWLTVSSQPIYATILGVPLRDLFKNSLFPSELLFYTDTLSIIGIYIYSIGLYIAVKKSIKNIDESIWDLYDPKKLLIIYIYVSFFIAINSAIIWNFPSLVQYVYFLFYIKWGFFIVTFMMIFKKAPYLKIPIFSIIIIEFILGLSTYFARFLRRLK